MNRRQLIAMWVGVGVICLMILVPPWEKDGWAYYPIIAPPTYYSSYLGGTTRREIDWTRLWMQISVAAILTIAGIVTFRKPNVKPDLKRAEQAEKKR